MAAYQSLNPLNNPVVGSVSVSGTAVPLIGSSTLVSTELKLVAAKANSGTVYIGFSSAVTAASAIATDGFELTASAVLNIPISAIPGGDLANIWAIASTSSQKVFFLAY